MKFNTIEEIAAHQFAGNAYCDMDAFTAIEQFVKSDASLADKAESLRIMSDRGMGCGRTPEMTDEEVVTQYLSFSS